jgi:hypothetical protein
MATIKIPRRSKKKTRSSMAAYESVKYIWPHTILCTGPYKRFKRSLYTQCWGRKFWKVQVPKELFHCLRTFEGTWSLFIQVNVQVKKFTIAENFWKFKSSFQILPYSPVWLRSDTWAVKCWYTTIPVTTTTTTTNIRDGGLSDEHRPQDLAFSRISWLRWMSMDIQ